MTTLRDLSNQIEALTGECLYSGRGDSTKTWYMAGEYMHSEADARHYLEEELRKAKEAKGNT